MNYTIKKYRRENYEFIYYTKKVVYKAYVEANFGEWNEEVQRNMFEKFIAEYEKDIIIIAVEDKNAGFYHYENLDDRIELGNLCLLPEFQGQGIGTKIIKGIIENNRHKNIYLKVFKQNPAIRLYKRLGFKNYEEMDHHFKMVLKAKEITKEI